ncbi:hypothetical protein SAMN05660477_02821 [Soonwooa buanensis]|uniref:Dolichyl-phosphate-mannose-protein mannosyltransferase n=1 Tax=Soonwooa buanensis TaxID=619805 RepID=A0A1T5GHB9_9FLAO|nr:hypothetical protein [Soonwooa buanensis]SKC07798.1 hypothetical protein SAMN05660477_02821 [Soonwooa buanensis]
MLESRYLFQNSHKLTLGILLSIFFSIIVILYRDLIIDDAFITFQYARNFAEHFKPWYNLDPFYQGNGQTSILWMLLLSLFNLFGVASEHIFYIINLFLGYFLIYQFVNFLFKDKLSLFEVIYKIAFLVFFSFWMGLNATHGLETLLSTVILLMFLKNWKKPNNYWSLLMLLVRPEFALYLVFWVLDSDFKEIKTFFRKVILASSTFILIVIFYLVFFDYYIPLPLVLKSQSSEFSLVSIKVAIGYLVLYMPIIVSLFKQKRYLFLAPLVFFILYYTFGINSYSGNIYIRYFFPLLAYFFFIDFKLKINQWFFTLICTLSMLRMLDLGFNFNTDRKNVIIDNDGFMTSYGEMAKHIKPTDKVLIMDAGHVAYFTNAMVYDGLGLNDATMLLARKHNDNATYKNYVESRKMNIISVVSSEPDRFVPREDSTFTYNSLNLKSKKLLYVFPLDNHFFLFVYQY